MHSVSNYWDCTESLIPYGNVPVYNIIVNTLSAKIHRDCSFC